MKVLQNSFLGLIPGTQNDPHFAAEILKKALDPTSEIWKNSSVIYFSSFETDPRIVGELQCFCDAFALNIV